MIKLYFLPDFVIKETIVSIASFIIIYSPATIISSKQIDTGPS